MQDKLYTSTKQVVKRLEKILEEVEHMRDHLFIDASNGEEKFSLDGTEAKVYMELAKITRSIGIGKSIIEKL